MTEQRNTHGRWLAEELVSTAVSGFRGPALGTCPAADAGGGVDRVAGRKLRLTETLHNTFTPCVGTRLNYFFHWPAATVGSLFSWPTIPELATTRAQASYDMM